MSDDLREMFRAYDIRGRNDQLTPEVMEQVGRAYGTFLSRKKEVKKVVVGHDMRTTSPELKEAFINGLQATPVEEIHDVGLEPFGVALFHGWRNDLEIAYITASHLSQEWNGVKFYHANGVGYVEEENMTIRDLFFDGEFEEGEEAAIVRPTDAREKYLKHVLSQVDEGDMKIVLDCGNGMAGLTAPEMFEKAGFDVKPLFDEPKGSFPNRESDVTEGSIKQLREKVAEADLGIAYDGDSDRCALVTPSGRLLEADETAYIVLGEMLKEWKGTVVANVECSRMIEEIAEEMCCEVERVRVGHTYLCKAAIEHDAVFGVEKAGHFVVPHIFPIDDGVAASLFFAATIARMDGSLEERLDAMPQYHRARLPFECPDAIKFDVVKKLQDELTDEYEETNTVDGIRVDLEDGWILIRASNTSPKVRLTVETEDEDAFDRLKQRFSERLEAAIEERR